MKNINPQIIVRISIAILFLWFGINQIFLPNDFRGYVPEFVLTSNFASQMLLINGIFETIFGILLLLGIFVRISSFILSIHLLIITFSLGYNDIAVRDFILTLITFSICIGGADKWCLVKKY